jgi:hypothetical protein
MKTIYRYLSVCGVLDQARGICGDRQIGITVLCDGAKTMEEGSDNGRNNKQTTESSGDLGRSGSDGVGIRASYFRLLLQLAISLHNCLVLFAFLLEPGDLCNGLHNALSFYFVLQLHTLLIFFVVI